MEQLPIPENDKNNRFVTRKDIAEAILKVSISEEIFNLLFNDRRSKPTILYDISHYIEAAHYRMYRRNLSVEKKDNRKVTLDVNQTRSVLENLIKTKITQNTKRKFAGYNIVLNEELVQKVLIYLFGDDLDQTEM